MPKEEIELEPPKPKTVKVPKKGGTSGATPGGTTRPVVAGSSSSRVSPAGRSQASRGRPSIAAAAATTPTSTATPAGGVAPSPHLPNAIPGSTATTTIPTTHHNSVTPQVSSI